jgi:DNA polymerase-4
LPIKNVSGVGAKTLKTLEDLGIHYLGDVQHVSGSLLEKSLGKFSLRLLELSRGIDDSSVVPNTDPKSISSEDTLPQDTNRIEVLKKQLLLQSEIVGRRLRQNGLKGKTITLKLKKSDFQLITRSITLDHVTDSAQILFEQGVRLLENVFKPGKFRLIGIGVSNLSQADTLPQQMDLFGKSNSVENSWGKVEKAMDLIQHRFGQNAIERGGLIKKKTR